MSGMISTFFYQKMYTVSDVCLNGGITRGTGGAAMLLMIVESAKDLRRNFTIALIFKFFRMSVERHQSLVEKSFGINFFVETNFTLIKG